MKLPFRTEVEGLRAVAVLAVVGFHAGVPYFSGGYVGVDVFFVISGFLITGLLLKEIRQTGRVRISEFYARRARRILPSAAVVLAATLVAGWLILPPLRHPDLAWDAITSALNVANWQFIGHNTDYMAAGQAQSPLLHFWSLAVEEQFYLLLAPLLWLLARYFRRLIAPVLILVTAGSFVLSLYWTQLNQPLAYMASPARAWQFGLGGLLALLAWAPRQTRKRPRKFPAHALGILGVGAIGASIVQFTSKTPFPGWAAVLPTLGAVAVIWGGASGVVGRLLSVKPMRVIGQVSFAWYLWHWPVLTLAEAAAGELSWPVKTALAVSSLLPAWLTTRFVERPLRYARGLSVGARPGLNLGLTATILPVVVALTVGSSSLNAMATDVTNLQLVGAKRGPSLVTEPVREGGPVPAPFHAAKDFPLTPGCQVGPEGTTSPKCLFGNTTSPDRIVLFGDSHATEWFPVAEAIAKRHNWSVEVLTKSGCPVPKMDVYNPQLGRTYTECDTWRANTLQRISAEPKPKMIMVGSLNQYDPPEAMAAGWKQTLKTLTATGAPVVYLRDHPIPGKDIPACVSGAADDLSQCAFPAASALRPDPVADHPPKGVTVVDVVDALCPPGQMCPAVKDGILLYRDNSHLTNTAATLLAPRVEEQIRRLRVLD
ncbi:acyltransferase family protein [Streptomyces sp. NBC_01304]|uniref:acyltransferase family protein n=1 Tax=Streptomyces sp. NBC_01304 TaxID=2903818 RepID=UPI002E0F07A2|nr:acyltransferase [Streptomyces sp. NBC_01304]